MPIEVRLPQLAEGMTSAKLTAWLKREGDTITSGEPIAEVETDKTSVELEAPHSGLLEKIHVPAGTDEVAVGTLLAIIMEQSTTSQAQPSQKPPRSVRARIHEVEPSQSSLDKPTATSFKTAEDGIPAAAPETTAATEIAATPLATRMARLAGLDLSVIGPKAGERITKADVDAALKRRRSSRPTKEFERVAEPPAHSAAAAPELSRAAVIGAYVDQPLSAMRRVTAVRLQQAKQTIPHFYLQIVCVADQLLDLRAKVNARCSGGKTTVTDSIVLAAALALRKVPLANSSWADTAVRVYDGIDIAVAVNTPNGLITPVIRRCDVKTLAVISRELNALTERARRGELKHEEYAGGTFTISNLGMFGVTSVMPIINPPQSCILGVGAIEQQPVVRDGQLAVGKVMSCVLAADHRAVDGTTGAELLAELRQLIEDPIQIVSHVGEG